MEGQADCRSLARGNIGGDEIEVRNFAYEQCVLGDSHYSWEVRPGGLALSDPRLCEGRGSSDQRIRERVVLTIGLFCHAAIEHEAFEIIWDSLGAKKDRAVKFVSRIGKHPGAPHIELDDGSMHPVYFGNKRGFRPSSMEMINILYRLYTPERCLTCFDGLAEFADIAVGDPWMAPPG